MDPFSYLSVLLSIIIGLAITQVLQGYRALLLNRRRVRLFFPPLAWSACLLLIAVQMWWSSFGLAGRSEWSFLAFFIILFQTILLYVMAGLVLPDLPPDDTLDLRDHYLRERLPFGATFAAIIVVSVIKNLMLDGGFSSWSEVLFHALFFGLAVVMMIARRVWVHHVLTAVISASFVTYIAILFARL